MTIESFIAGMPKAENHIHQDGATSPAAALRLAARHHMTLPFRTPEEAEALFQYESLGDFIRVIDSVNAVIRDEDDIAYLLTELGRDAARQNIRYREVMLANDFHERMGLSLDAQMRGFVRGRRAAKALFGVELACIPEVDRTMDPRRSAGFPERLEPWRGEANIVAIGLESAEAGFPARLHREAFQNARALGYPVTSHAGEACGPESIWDALESIGSGRIDHGVRAVEDPDLVRYLAEHQILLTVCPYSNLSLHIFPDMEHHSIRQLMDAGVPVSINSDDPPFFRGDLNKNYVGVVRAFRLTKQQLLPVAENAFTRSYAPKALIDASVRELRAYFESHDYTL